MITKIIWIGKSFCFQKLQIDVTFEWIFMLFQFLFIKNSFKVYSCFQFLTRSGPAFSNNNLISTQRKNKFTVMKEFADFAQHKRFKNARKGIQAAEILIYYDSFRGAYIHSDSLLLIWSDCSQHLLLNSWKVVKRVGKLRELFTK